MWGACDIPRSGRGGSAWGRIQTHRIPKPAELVQPRGLVHRGAKRKRESNGAGATSPLSPSSQPLETFLLSQHREEETESAQGKGKHLLIQTQHIVTLTK